MLEEDLEATLWSWISLSSDNKPIRSDKLFLQLVDNPCCKGQASRRRCSPLRWSWVLFPAVLTRKVCPCSKVKLGALHKLSCCPIMNTEDWQTCCVDAWVPGSKLNTGKVSGIKLVQAVLWPGVSFFEVLLLWPLKICAPIFLKLCFWNFEKQDFQQNCLHSAT